VTCGDGELTLSGATADNQCLRWFAPKVGRRRGDLNDVPSFAEGLVSRQQDVQLVSNQLPARSTDKDDYWKPGERRGRGLRCQLP
jgi:hypothetical protein